MSSLSRIIQQLSLSSWQQRPLLFLSFSTFFLWITWTLLVTRMSPFSIPDLQLNLWRLGLFYVVTACMIWFSWSTLLSFLVLSWSHESSPRRTLSLSFRLSYALSASTVLILLLQQFRLLQTYALVAILLLTLLQLWLIVRFSQSTEAQPQQKKAITEGLFGL